MVSDSKETNKKENIQKVQVIYDELSQTPRYVNVESINRRQYDVKIIKDKYTVTRHLDNKQISTKHIPLCKTTPSPSSYPEDTPYFKEDFNTYIKLGGQEYRYGIDKMNNEFIITCQDDPANNSYKKDCRRPLTKARWSGSDDAYCKDPSLYPTGPTTEDEDSEPLGGYLAYIAPVVLLGGIIALGWWLSKNSTQISTKLVGAGPTKQMSQYFKSGFTMFMIPFGMVLMIGFIGYSLYSIGTSKSTWCFDPNHKNVHKKVRASSRGTFISIALTLSAIVQQLMQAGGADSTLLLYMYGFILAAILGYIGDKVVGTEEGYAVFNKSKKNALKYGMGSLTGPEFFRYIITVFLDMFISTPIQVVLTYLFRGYIQELSTNQTGIGILDSGLLSGLTSLVGNSFDNILQSVVAIITFMAYTNDTRFLWAYPDKSLLKEERLPTSMIKLATSLAAVIFLIANYPKIGGNNNKVAEEGFSGSPMGPALGIKLVYVLITIFLLTIGSYGIGFTNEPESTYKVKKVVRYNKTLGKYEVVQNVQDVSNELDSAQDVQNKWPNGLIFFAFLLAIGFTLPLMAGKDAGTVSKILAVVIPVAIVGIIFVICQA